jgi:hypothetical protein
VSRRIAVELTEAQLHLIAEALDSHVYWQLSSPQYRHDATVIAPGSDDGESVEEIRSVLDLVDRLEVALGQPITRPIGPAVS